MAERLMTTHEAAAVLKLSERRVRAMIQEGRLPARKLGRDHIIRERDLALVAVRKPGRPKEDK